MVSATRMETEGLLVLSKLLRAEQSGEENRVEVRAPVCATQARKPSCCAHPTQLFPGPARSTETAGQLQRDWQQTLAALPALPLVRRGCGALLGRDRGCSSLPRVFSSPCHTALTPTLSSLTLDGVIQLLLTQISQVPPGEP